LPHFVLARRLEKNYHGFGKYRGGACYCEISTPYGEGGCFLSSWGAADKLSHNPGLMAGYMGPPNPRIIVQDTDLLERIERGEDIDLDNYDLIRDQTLKGTYRIEASGQTTEKRREGDLMMYGLGGGGGYGDVLERDPALVARDIADDMITAEVAHRVYGVVIDAATGLVDEAATADRRAAMRRERLARGKPFAEFIAAWLDRRPPERITKFYGAYPEPRVPHYRKPFWGLYD